MARFLNRNQLGELLRAIDAYAGHGVTRIAIQLLPHMMARPGELRKATVVRVRSRESGLEDAARADEDAAIVCRALSRQVLALPCGITRRDGPRGVRLPGLSHMERSMSENTINQAFRRMGYHGRDYRPRAANDGVDPTQRERQMEPRCDRAVAGACRQATRSAESTIAGAIGRSALRCISGGAIISTSCGLSHQ